ncbi:MAG: ATP-binding cassette domain-containing protein [Gammaproteobacteria bacterium]|nr:ATP-binding cassette domain-containing protein [Gammaproteobacteria bacterium]
MQSNNESLPLRLNNVSYCVDEITLIKNVSLEITSPGTTVILGHNGSGKSLLLKLMHGVINPSSGQITWNNNHPNTNQFWRTFLLQRPTFFKQSVLSNVEFVLRIANTPKSEYKTRCQQALEICGLSKLADRNTHSLSGGELQKLSLARAWVLEPSVVLLDEPTVALDPPSVLGFENIIQQFKQSNTKVIMTTHDLSQAKRLADEIVFIDSGKVVEKSSAEKFFSGPESSQAQNFICGELV